MLSGLPWLRRGSSCCGLFISYSKLMQNALWTALALPVMVLIHFLFKFEAKCSLWFPIQFLFKFYTKCSLGCLGSSCYGFLFNSYSKLKQNALWAALAPLVVVPYSILIQFWHKTFSGVPWLPL